MESALMALALTAAPAEAQPASGASVAPPAMQRWAPGLAIDTDRVLFGDVWTRPSLSPRDRSLVTVSVLVATARTGPLEGHLGRALDNGVIPSEVGGLVTQLAHYTGWPNAVAALDVVDRVMRSRGIAPASVRMNGSLLPPAASEPTRARLVEAQVGPTAPKLAALTNDHLFAEVWRRTDIAPRDRSLVTIAALAAGGDVGQLGFHVRRGLENGLTRDEIAEAFTHLAFYAGWPKAMAAVAALADEDPTDTAAGDPIRVIPPNLDPRSGPADRFTGAVTVTSPFQGSGGARLSGATVTFAPGARTHWHSHALGQLLVVTTGRGLIQTEGGPVREIQTGDTIWTAPGVRHWHGAAPDTGLTHVAVSESDEQATVAWGGPVSEDSYRQPPLAAAR